jgi:hypothetical protein
VLCARARTPHKRTDTERLEEEEEKEEEEADEEEPELYETEVAPFRWRACAVEEDRVISRSLRRQQGPQAAARSSRGV